MDADWHLGETGNLPVGEYRDMVKVVVCRESGGGNREEYQD